MLAREIITRAFYEVNQSSYKIQDVDLSDGLRYLNRMMAKMEGEGVTLGYTNLSSVDDHVNVSPVVYLGMVKNLALILWNQYKADDINPLISIYAKKTKSTMLVQGFAEIDPSPYSGNLPMGSGNEYSDTFYTNKTAQDEYIGAENDG